MLRGLATLAGCALACVAAFAQGARSSAEIRIGLPPGEVISVQPGSHALVLELPGEAVFPHDFEVASGGLVRGGEPTPAGDRLRIELELVQSALQNVIYDPDGVVLRFASREAGVGVSDDPEESYTLGAGDRVELKVHNHPELSAEMTVNRDGTITAPVIGDVSAAGLDPRELASRVAEILGRNYLVDPQVDVEIVRYRSQWVMVAGEVRDPGRIALMGGTRLKEVVGDAGGFTEIAGEEIVVSRKATDAHAAEVLRIDRADFEAGLSDPLLRHGDFIDVTRARFCYVQGEVRRPDRVLIERGTTLLQAITLVGGLTDWADKRAVRILSGEGADRQERVVDLRKIQRGKSPDVELQGGEIIVVNRRFF